MPERVMLDLPKAYMAAQQLRTMQRTEQEQEGENALRSLYGAYNKPETGFDRGGFQKAASEKGLDFQAEEMLSKLDERQFKQVKDRLESMSGIAWSLNDQYEDDVKKAGPEVALQKLRSSYGHLYNSNPLLKLPDMRKTIPTPDQITYEDVSSSIYQSKKTLDAMTKIELAKIRASRPYGGGGVTLTQEARNDEIDQAREELSLMGLTKEDIQRKIQKFGDLGRDNPDYDPLVGKVVAQATRRKVGADPDYKNFYSNFIGSGGEKKAAAPAGTPAGKAMSESDARKALASKGIKGSDANKWIAKYKQAGKVR